MNALIPHHAVSLCASTQLVLTSVSARLVTAKIILKTRNYIVQMLMSATKKLAA